MKTIMIAVLLFGFGVEAYGGTEGHGGDPLRLMFEDARPFAAERVLKAESCAFGSNVSVETREWILNHRQALAEDIQQSAHVWITDQQATCAFTQTDSRADITLSFETCRPGIRDTSDALKILVHESVHHFGIVDENFADRVAEAIYLLGSHSTCDIPPSENPFDPASCPGNHLSAGDLLKMIPLPEFNRKEVGGFRATSRMRTCYGPTWCSSWRDADAFGLSASIHNSGTLAEKAIPSIPTGKVAVALKNNRPTLLLDGDPGIPGYSYGFSMTGQIERYNLIFDISANSPTSTPRVGHTVLMARSSVGWMTRNCFRYVTKGVRTSVDNLENSVNLEYETVLHSKFGR